MKRTILATAITAISMGAIADENQNYVGLSTGFVKYSEDIVDEDARFMTLSLIAGHKFNEFVSIEGRVGGGVSEDSIEIYDGYYDSISIDISLDYMISTFMKFSLPNEHTVTPYLLVGATKGKVTAEAMGYSISETENDFSYGVGLEFTGSEDKTIGVNFEYVNYFDKNGAEIGGLNVGLIKRF